ncbi:MAG: MBL fold metallo-hydrolase [Clostridia bacterium]|nr:MBL fold metallo-hydrolase [Clostridia bacterium]
MRVYSAVIGSYQTNCYLLTDPESGETAAIDCAVFDCDYQRFLAEAGVARLKYILLTHGHFDHISGVKALRDACGGTVCIHAADADCLTDETRSLNAYVDYAVLQPVSADCLIDEKSVLTLGSHAITVMPTPGHTPGSVCFLTDDGKMFSGDTLFRLSMGRTDMPGGSTRTLFASLRQIGALEGDYTVYPGHMEQTTLEFEKKYNRYLHAK